MDDTVILAHSKDELRIIQRKLSLFAKIYMKLKFSKWHICSMATPINFLGYRISANYKLVRRDSVVRAKRKIKRYKGKADTEALKKFLASWSGHLRSADSFNLKHYIRKELLQTKEIA